MKLCKDCKHIEEGPVSLTSRCMSPKAKHTPNPVTGDTPQGFADLARGRETACGIEARWFEPKEETHAHA